MKDFLSRNALFIGVVVGTLLLLVGGVYFFSKGGGPSKGKQIGDEILIPKGTYITGGIKEGKYQPAKQNAKAVLVEFGDYQCPACGAYNTLTVKLLEEFNGKMNLAFRNFPLSQHANGLVSSYAAEAAGIQGKFWEMHEKLYKNQEQWANSTDAKSIFTGYAKEMKLDLAKFAADMDSASVKEKVSKDSADGNLVGITGTPTYFLNGYKIENPGSYEDFKKLIEEALKNTNVIQSPAPEAYHIHFDLKVYTNAKRLDLSLAKYQSSEEEELDSDIHLHDGNGNIVHVHATGIPLKNLFDSLKITFPKDTAALTLKLYVNGQPNGEVLNYVPKDIDRILLTYGPKDDKNLTTQINSVTDLACIFSLKCPERGTPPPESCIGGVGSNCTE